MIEDINSFTWVRLAGVSWPTPVKIVRLVHCVWLFGLMMVQMCVLGGVNTQNFHALLLIKIQKRSLKWKVNNLSTLATFVRRTFLYYGTFAVSGIPGLSVNIDVIMKANLFCYFQKHIARNAQSGDLDLYL